MNKILFRALLITGVVFLASCANKGSEVSINSQVYNPLTAALPPETAQNAVYTEQELSSFSKKMMISDREEAELVHKASAGDVESMELLAGVYLLNPHKRNRQAQVYWSVRIADTNSWKSGAAISNVCKWLIEQGKFNEADEFVNKYYTQNIDRTTLGYLQAIKGEVKRAREQDEYTKSKQRGLRQ